MKRVGLWGTRGSLPVALTAVGVRAKLRTALHGASGRTFDSDADIERLTSVKTLKRLDLSLTYVSDRGVEQLKRLDQLEDLNLYAAEFVTEESRDVVGREELNAFHDDVDAIRDDVERLQARVERLRGRSA